MGGAVVVAVVVVTVSTLGTAGSFFYAMRGQYATSSLQLMVDRAEVVAPVAHPLQWLAVIALGWVACIVATTVLVSQRWRRPLKHARGRRTPSDH